jgi:MFS transporter, SP family, galactose:H+ symporter
MSSVSSNSGAKTVFWVCFLAALAGLLFGIDIGVIAQAKEFIITDLKLSENEISWVVGSMMGGAAIGAIGAGFLTRRLGRKISLILGALLFLIGAMGCALSWDATSLICFRITLGVAIGIASFTAPLYLSEVAPQSIRGTMISMYQLMITIGILVAFLSNAAIRGSTYIEGVEGVATDYLFTVSTSWRWMLGVTAIPATIFLLGVFTLPRSPRWLVSVGRSEQAFEVLKHIRGSEEDAQKEVNEIIDTVNNKQSGGFNFFLNNKNFRRTVILGVVLQIAQQLTGMNVIMYYGPELIKSAGFVSASAQDWGTVMFGLTNVLATFIAIYLVDKWGRKPILILGFIIMAISLGAVALLMSMTPTGILSYLAIAFVLLFIICFAFSAGPLIWVLCSEIQPLSGRDFGITCSTGTNWIANMIVGASFLTLLNHFGASGTMLMYAGFCVVSIFVTMFFVPETKGVSLEHLEKNLMNGAKLKDLGKL